MKYMGHKGRILPAIRTRIRTFAEGAATLCDPFCGSGVVAWDLAEQFDKPVLAGDLQTFATARAAAVVTRTEPVEKLDFVSQWFERAKDLIREATHRCSIPIAPAVADSK